MKKSILVLSLFVSQISYAKLPSDASCVHSADEVECSNAVIVFDSVTAHCYRTVTFLKSDNSLQTVRFHGMGELFTRQGNQASALQKAQTDLADKLKEAAKLPDCPAAR